MRPSSSYRAPNIADAHHERALNPPPLSPLLFLHSSILLYFLPVLHFEHRKEGEKNNKTRARSAKFSRVCRTGGEDAMAAPVKAALVLLILTVASKFHFSILLLLEPSRDYRGASTLGVLFMI